MFSDASLAQAPANFGPKRFFGKLIPNPSCVATKFEVDSFNGCRNK